MNKTQAAEILANHITVVARREAREAGQRVSIDKDMIEEMVSELAEHGEGQIREAARTFPHWTTIRTIGRRNQT